MEASALPYRRRLRVTRALLRALGDDALVEHIRSGDERAFEVVYDRYHANLLAFCRQMLGSADEAEDALQQVLVAAHGDLLRSRRSISLKPWLYAIARNRCLSILRTRRELCCEFVETARIDLPDEVERRLELRELLADVRALPDDQRAALVLAQIGDLSHAEIGDVIGCDPRKVKALIFQARTRLAQARRSREMSCAEIREQLATLTGPALRRAEIRSHLKVCPGCAEFREEVRRQRAMMALLLPVVPSVGLKRSILASVGIGSASAGGAAKLVVAGVIGTMAIGGGVAVEEHDLLASRSAPAAVPAAAVRAKHTSAPAARAVPAGRLARPAPRHAPAPPAPARRVERKPAAPLAVTGAPQVSAPALPAPAAPRPQAQHGATHPARPQHSTPGTRHPTPGTRHPRPGTQHPTPTTQHPTPTTQRQSNSKPGITPPPVPPQAANPPAQPGIPGPRHASSVTPARSH